MRLGVHPNLNGTTKEMEMNLQMKSAVLIVIGSVRERDLNEPKFQLLDDGKHAKVVRMSAREFQTDFRHLLVRHGIDNLSEIGCYHDLVSWAKAIHAARGHIGGIVMDSPTWSAAKHLMGLLGDRPVWMVHGGICKRLPVPA